jgi:Fe(II)/alpha-ketoglutarate-dependent arginine beta-hydroxylase
VADRAVPGETSTDVDCRVHQGRNAVTTSTRAISQYHLRPAETAQLRACLPASWPLGRPTDPEFYDRHWDLPVRLPGGLRRFLQEFRHQQAAAACLVYGLPVEDGTVGPTPAHWREAADSRSTQEQEFYLAMCALALGEPYTWASLQAGLMIQNILPIAGDEQRQSGHGSEAFLEFHTEDGFHPGRCDYLLLLGIRNPDRVPTYLASVRDLDLPDDVRQVLSQPRFLILPDDEHVRQLREQYPQHPALARMLAMQQRPEPVPVLFGDPAAPYLRIDRPFMRCAGDDPAAGQALDVLMAELKRVSRPVVLEPGTLLVVDNYLAVHGRKAFRCRYDGTDRWLKRMIVSRDLRRTTLAATPHRPRVLC